MKKYAYKGKEISRAKANLMVAGAITGMIAGAFGLWVLTIFLEVLIQHAGGAI